MNDEEKKKGEKNKAVDVNPEPLKVSKAVFDEATGTLTLRLATDEEIAEDERLKAERLMQEKELDDEQ